MADSVTVSLPPDIAAAMNAIATGTNMNNSVSMNAGYLRPQDALYTPQGQQWVQGLVDLYRTNAGGGWNPDGTALNGSIYGLPDVASGEASIYNAIAQGAQGVGPLANWVTSQGGMPAVNSLARDQHLDNNALARDQMMLADQLARDLNESNNAIKRWEVETQAQLARDLQAGLISHQQHQQAAQHAHEKVLQAEQMAFNYAELAWEQEYGRESLSILRDRLALDTTISEWQRDHDARRVAVEEGRLGLERDRFGLDKQMQEAQLRANPYNAVANALYMRGQQPQGGFDQFGAPLTTLDNSGTLPFLQQLQQGGIQSPIQFGGQTPLNSGGIGGNVAPAPNSISQQSFGNMSENERGIATSLAQFGGYNPADYWKSMQRSWNTAGQGAMNFGTRLS